MTTIANCIWFDGTAEDAARFYVSLLPDSRVDHVARYPLDTPGGRAGDVMLVEFTLAGVRYQGLNGGAGTPHSPAFSISVLCDTQTEIDRLWAALTAEGGSPVQCGWLTDRYGVSWQIVPRDFVDRLRHGEPERVRRGMEAMMGMVKLDRAALQRAYDGT